MDDGGKGFESSEAPGSGKEGQEGGEFFRAGGFDGSKTVGKGAE